MKSGRHRAVILTATKEEYEAVRRHLDGLSIKQIPLDYSGIYEQSKFYANDELWDITIAQIGQRNVKAALETAQAIESFKPQIILFLGTAGGIKTKDLRIGDVVVATKAYDYDSGYAGEELLPRPEGCDSHERLIGLARYCITQAKRRQRNARWDFWRGTKGLFRQYSIRI